MEFNTIKYDFDFRYRKLLLELGIVVGTQIFYVLQKRFLVDGPDDEGTRKKKQSVKDRRGNYFLDCKLILGVGDNKSAACMPIKCVKCDLLE